MVPVKTVDQVWYQVWTGLGLLRWYLAIAPASASSKSDPDLQCPVRKHAKQNWPPTTLVHSCLEQLETLSKHVLQRKFQLHKRAQSMSEVFEVCPKRSHMMAPDSAECAPELYKCPRTPPYETLLALI